jgi:hypothetical protein
MSNYVFNNSVSSIPFNPNVAFNNSWITVGNNADRELYAQASYITNLDGLSVTLSAGNLDIGSVHIIDKDTGLAVSVADIGTGLGAIRVLSQDLESNIDDITIGDKNGNFAYVTNSALNVFQTNNVSAVSVTNFPTQLTAVSITNQLTGITVLNPVSSFSLTNQSTSVNVTNFPTQLTAVSVTNQLTSTSVTVLNPVSSFTLLNSSIEISNDIGNPIPVSFTSSISTTPVGNQLVTFAASPQLDTNNRLKVVVPAQSWWYISSVDKDGDLRVVESLTPNASSIFVQNLASVTLTSGTSLTGSAVRASRRRFKVRPGVSQEWLGTVNFDGQDTGTIKRIGTYTNYNGMFFELSGTNFNVVVRRRLTDGTLAEERVNQTNFSVDKLDGNGPSGQNWYTSLSGTLISGTNRWPVAVSGDGNVYNAAFTYSNGLSSLKPGSKGTITGVTPSGYNGAAYIAAVNAATNTLTATYIIDPGTYSSVNGNARFITTPYHNAHTLFFEFNGGRTAKVNFGINGSTGPTYLHQFDFSNQLGLQYESAPALMDRKDVINYSAMSYNPTMTVDGTSINIEAESSLNPAFVTAYNITPITLVAGKDQPVLGLALRTGEPYQRGDIQIQGISVIDTGNLNTGGNAKISASVLHWKLLLNPSLSGEPSSTNVGKCSRQWSYTSTSAVTANGIELLSGFITSGSPIDVKTSLNFLNLGSNIEYTDSDKVVLTARLIHAGSETSTLVGSLNAIEAL